MNKLDSWLSVIFIHQLIESEPRRWNATSLKQELGISTRTIQRFLRFMEKHGAAIRYDKSKKAFYYAEPMTDTRHFLPFEELNPMQLQTLKGAIDRELERRISQRSDRVKSQMKRRRVVNA